MFLSYQTTLYLVERDLPFNVKHLVCIKLKQIKVLCFVTDRSRPVVWIFNMMLHRKHNKDEEANNSHQHILRTVKSQKVHR